MGNSNSHRGVRMPRGLIPVANGPATVVVAGDINVDILVPVTQFPKPGEECLSEGLEIHCGGVAANAALSLARWGVRVRLLGRVGQDRFGEWVLDVLRREKIDTTWVQSSPRAMTGLFFSVVLPGGERTMFGSRGANAELTAPTDNGYLERAQAAYLVGYSFLSSSAAETAEYLLGQIHRRGGWVSLDVGVAPSRQVSGKILDLVRKADVVFVNAEEAAALTDKRDAVSAFETLQSLGARELVMKLGARGSLIRDGAELIGAPAFPVGATDSTGAGDAFAAAYFWARLRGWSSREAALLANAAGGAAATVVGAGEGMPTPRQVLRMASAGYFDGEWCSVQRRVLERLREEFGVEGTGEIREERA